MVKLKVQFPVVDEDGSILLGLIKTWAEDEEGQRYLIRQLETGYEYEEALDVAKITENEYGQTIAIPELVSYEVTDIKVEEPQEDENIILDEDEEDLS